MSRNSLLLLLLFSKFLSASTSLQVQHPQQTWRSCRAEISEATLSVRPVGLYMEYGLYLTITAPSNYFSSKDSVEIQFYFELSTDAIMHDLWLWVDGKIMRGQIMDRWRASNIYEGIVKRRRDPAILFKNSASQYQLMVYPVAGGSSRKVKLTWLEPTSWTSESVSAALPVQMLKASAIQLPHLQFMYWPGKAWWSPRIPEIPALRFKTTVDSSGAVCDMALIPGSEFSKSLHISANAPLNQGIYLSRLELGGEGLYQLAFLPDKVLQAGNMRKLIFLLDYDAARSTQSSDEWIRDIKYQLKRFLQPADSINILASQLNIRRASEKWLPGDSVSVENAIKALGSVPLAGYSNLPSLLKNGIDFINNSGRSGQLILISNTDQHGDYRVANPLIKDLLAAMNPVIPVYVADLSYSNPLSYYFNGRTYSGNEYLYLNLCQQTHGQYVSLRSLGSLSETLSQILTVFTKPDQPFDFHAGLAHGFCYQRVDLSPASGQYAMNTPILQIGRYQGQTPFLLEASGIVNTLPFTRTITIIEEDLLPADSLLQEIWSGRQILRLESGLRSNAVIDQIINISLTERVLSSYTAFLALEPSDKVPVCRQCEDESRKFTSVEKNDHESKNDSLLQSYPNPFNERTTIKLSLRHAVKSEQVTLAIYNIRGQQVCSYTPPSVALGQEWTVYWDGHDETGRAVSSGTYLVVASVGIKKQTIKIQLLK